jgi:ATP-dependent protease ClpP protease subunit
MEGRRIFATIGEPTGHDEWPLDPCAKLLSETILNADEAVGYGLVDALVGSHTSRALVSAV